MSAENWRGKEVKRREQRKKQKKRLSYKTNSRSPASGGFYVIEWRRNILMGMSLSHCWSMIENYEDTCRSDDGEARQEKQVLALNAWKRNKHKLRRLMRKN